MLSYIPLLITFLLGIVGVMLRTKHENSKHLLNRPTVGGWVVLLLLTVSLAVGGNLEAEKHRARRTAVKQDSLKHIADSARIIQNSDRYRNTIKLLNAQLSHQNEQLRYQRELADSSSASFARQQMLASEQIDFLRNLTLLQHEISGVEVRWSLSKAQRDLIDGTLRSRRDSSAAIPYLTGAIYQGRVNVWKSRGGRTELEVLLFRPQGLYSERFPDSSVEWRAFESAMKAVLGNRFEVEVAPGVFLADLARRHWPAEVSVAGGVISFVVDRPGVRLGQLKDARVTFWAASPWPEELPREIRLVSRDSRVPFDQTFDLRWTPKVLRSYGWAPPEDDADDEYRVELRNSTAGPYPLAATLEMDLLSP